MTDLNKATIGLYATFKEHWVLILEEIAKQLKERYPGATFTRFQYAKDLNSYTQVAELAKDPEVRPGFEEWVKGVDAVIVANADAGSCTLYLTYNATVPGASGQADGAHRGRGVRRDLLKRAAELRGVPALRYVKLDLLDLAMEPDITHLVDVVIPERVREMHRRDHRRPDRAAHARGGGRPGRPENTPRVAMKGTLAGGQQVLLPAGLGLRHAHHASHARRPSTRC